MLRQLCVLILRENKLRSLPEEISECCQLTVLDLRCNYLQNIPTSVSKLGLKALWLAENQSKPLPSLQDDVDVVTNSSVLSCCLLPQFREEIEDNLDWRVETTRPLNMKYSNVTDRYSISSSEIECSPARSKKGTVRTVQYRWPGT